MDLVNIKNLISEFALSVSRILIINSKSNFG